MFLETLGHFQLNGDDSRYHDCHQEDQEYQEPQECPLSTGMFFMVIFAPKTIIYFWKPYIPSSLSPYS